MTIGVAGGHTGRMLRIAALTVLAFALLVPAAAAQESGGAAAPEALPAPAATVPVDPPPVPEPPPVADPGPAAADPPAGAETEPPPVPQAPPVPNPAGSAPAPELPPAAPTPASGPSVQPAPPAPEPLLQSTVPAVGTGPALPLSAAPAVNPAAVGAAAPPPGTAPAASGTSSVLETVLPGASVLPPGFGPAEADPEAAAADASTLAQPDLPESSGPLPAEAEDSGLAPLSPARSADRTFGEALKLMDDLAGVKTAMAMLAERGREPAQAPPAHGGSGSQKGGPDHVPSAEFPPLAGGAPSGAAGSASSGTGSAALYALMIALAASVLGLWGRLQLVPVRWRSVAVVALVERPG